MIGHAELTAIAENAMLASDNKKLYETWGIDTDALIATSNVYAQSVASHLESSGVMGVLMVAFLAGFDVGYLSRMQIESEGSESAPDFVPENFTEESK